MNTFTMIHHLNYIFPTHNKPIERINLRYQYQS